MSSDGIGKIIYEEVLPFICASTSHDHFKGSHNWSQHAMVSVRLIDYDGLYMIQLLKEDQPNFLYQLDMNPAAFQRIKMAQHLQFEYCDFGKWLITMLENSSGSQNHEKSEEESKSRYKIYFTQNIPDRYDPNFEFADAELDIVQPNQFQRIILLNLRFDPPSSAIMLRHCWRCILSLKKEKRESEEKSHQILKALDDARGDFSHSEQDLKSKLERMMEDAQVLRSQLSHSQKLLEQENKQREFYDGSIKQLEREKAALELKCAELDAQHRHFAFDLEQKREITSEISEELRSVKERFHELLKENERLNEDLAQKNRKMTELKDLLDRQKLEIQEREDVASDFIEKRKTYHQLTQQMQKEMVIQEETLRAKNFEIEKQKAKIDELIVEINRLKSNSANSNGTSAKLKRDFDRNKTGTNGLSTEVHRMKLQEPFRNNFSFDERKVANEIVEVKNVMNFNANNSASKVRGDDDLRPRNPPIF